MAAHCGALLHPLSCSCPSDAPAAPTYGPATPFVDGLNGRIEASKEAVREERAVELEAEAEAAETRREPTVFAGPVVKKQAGGQRAPWNQPRERPDPQAERNRLYEEIVAAAQDPEQRQALLDQINATLAKSSFSEFVRQAWHVIEPATKLQWNWHHELICSVMEALFFDWLRTKNEEGYVNACNNAVFNVPPGSLKSRIIAVCFHAWAWIHWPGLKLICLSVNDDATMRDARAARDLIRSPWYIDRFKPTWTIKSDQDATSNYGNTAGGERISMPSKSEIVGLRGDCFAGDTSVATEFGDLPIRELHERSECGDTLPRVWSLNHETGQPELKEVVATRKIKSRKTVVVSTETDYVQCTPDHRFYSEDHYTPASHLAGRSVSVLRRADVPIADEKTPTLQGLSVRDSYVHALSGRVPASRRRVRQAGETRRDRRTVLQQELQDDCHPTAGSDQDLSDVWGAVSNQRQVQSDLFGKVQGTLAQRNAFDARRETMPAMQRRVRSAVGLSGLLHRRMRGQGALDPNVRLRELELLGSRHSVSWRSLEQPAGVDSRARSQRVYLRRNRRIEWPSAAGASYRPQPEEQRSRKSHHALRRVPHDAPQIKSATVLSIDSPTTRGRQETVDVYDIQVAGNHNFFAAGLLVHNCILIDDPNNPKKSESKKERDEVNDLWDTNQYNRVNDPVRSLRIGVQQRTNAADWTGHVLDRQGTWSETNRDGWLHIALPAEYEKERRFVMPKKLRILVRGPTAVLDDPRKEEGESIDPVRMPKSYLDGERNRWKGTGNFAGQMQQRPALAEGAMVQRAWWNWCRLAGGVREAVDELDTGRPRPAHCHDGKAQVIHQKTFHPDQWDFDWITISVDCAAKKTTKGSNWGIIVVAGKGGRRYVLDDRTQRGALHEIIAIIKDLIRLWEPDSILIEAKAAGPDVMDTLLEQMGAGDCPMVTIEEAEPGNDDKEMRLDAALPYIRNSMVCLLDGAHWLEAFVEELSMFPNGLRDDRVDALSQILNHKRAMHDELPAW